MLASCTGRVRGVQCGVSQTGRSSEAGADVSRRGAVVDSLLHARAGRRRLRSDQRSQRSDHAHPPRLHDVARPCRRLRQYDTRLQTGRQSVPVSIVRFFYGHVSVWKL